MEGSWEQKQMKTFLETFTYEQFKQMQAEWLTTGRLLWYVYGNIERDTAIDTVEKGRSILCINSVPHDSLCDIRCMDISPGKLHRIDFEVEEKSNENSCLVSYWQFGMVGEGEEGMKNELLN